MNLEELPEYLPGMPAQYGLKQMNESFGQGESIILDFNLQFKDVPVRPNDWNLEAIIKKNTYANNILWSAKIGKYMFEKRPGLYYVVMPADVSALFLPGTYHCSIKGKQKVATGDPFDQTVSLKDFTFQIELKAMSPNPDLHGETTYETFYDYDTGVYTVRRTSVEPTHPNPVDITQS